MDSLEGNVKDITTESANLVTQLTKQGGTIDALKKELTAVSNVTEAYGKYRDSVQATITKLERLAELTGQEIKD